MHLAERGLSGRKGEEGKEGERQMEGWSGRKGKGQRLPIAIRLKKESRYPVSNVWVRLLGAVLG